MVKIRQLEDNKIGVSSPYDATFVNRARQLGGNFQYSTKEWIFDEEDKEKVEDKCIDIFAECGRPIETVRIDISLYEFIKSNPKCVFNHDLTLGLYTFAKSKGRDSYVELADNVIVSNGKLDTNGSVKNHYVDYTDDTILTFKKLPKKIYEKIKDYDGVTFINENELEEVPKEELLYKFVTVISCEHISDARYDLSLGVYEAHDKDEAINKVIEKYDEFKDYKHYIKVYKITE